MDEKAIKLKDLSHDQQLEVIRKRYGLTGDRAEFALAIELGEIDGDVVVLDDDFDDVDF